MMPAHGPCPRPLDPGRELPPATTAGRASPACLQPALGVASGDTQPVEPDRPDRLDALPEPDPGHQRADRVVTPARRREVPGRVPRRPGQLRPVHGQRLGPLVPSPLRPGAERADRLLLRRIRLPRIARDLLGRARRAGRRPHEVGQRHGPAGDRRGTALSEGLLPPVDRRRRPPGAQLPRLRPEPATAQPRPGSVGRPTDGHRRAARAGT